MCRQFHSRGRRRGATFISNDAGRRGFTLVELLVVVAIIALLVSILLPTLGKAKEQAKMVMCMSNLKSLGLGYNLYTSENNDWYPQASGGGGYSGPDAPAWDYVMKSYYGNRDLIHCPSDPPDGDPICTYTRSWAWEYDPVDVRYARSYAQNASVSGQGWSWAYPEWPRYIHKTTYVVEPNETILLSECWYWSYFGTGGFGPNIYNYYFGSHTTAGGGFNPGRCRGPTDSVHRNKDAANYLFCDSHVETLAANDPNLIEPDDYYFKINKD